MGLELKKTVLKHSLRSVDWLGDEIIDWENAVTAYSLSGGIRQTGQYHFGFGGDSAISSPDGRFALIYGKLGTKGLLLKDGELLREIDRSYYHSGTYEFPACFLQHAGTTYLVHCPRSYDRLEMEEAESGTRVTDTASREPEDFFHSRLIASPHGSRFLSRGWIWHPLDALSVYQTGECLKDPGLLDRNRGPGQPDCQGINAAGFIDEDSLLIGSSESADDSLVEILPEKSLAVWNLAGNTISTPVTPAFRFGNLTAINHTLAWDTYGHPKVFDFRTGELLAECREVATGLQNSAIIRHVGKIPPHGLQPGQDQAGDSPGRLPDHPIPGIIRPGA